MSAVSVDEAAWWAAARGGDADAFTRIFRLHRDGVFRQARRLGLGPEDADDVTAAAFLELWRRRDTVRVVNGSVRAWLLVTAGNITANQRRGLRRWRAVLDSLPREQPVGDGTDPAGLAEQRLDSGRSAVAAALGRLRPVDVGLLMLTVFDGYTLAEAAQLLGLTDATARSRLSRARSRLRADLEPEQLPAGAVVRRPS